jgi:tetratricopeptide (TPR) repeat protein
MRPRRDAVFNLAVLLEAVARPDEAADLYRAALAENPELADAHYNLALLCESAGLQQEAIRHLGPARMAETCVRLRSRDAVPGVVV